MIKPDRYSTVNSEVNLSIIYQDNSRGPKPNYTLPKNEFHTLMAFKSKKSESTRSVFQGIAGVLLATSIVTLANSYDFDEEGLREGVLISGGIQMGIGVIILALTKKKKYRARDGWRFLE